MCNPESAMETEITITRYNLSSLLGWIGLLLGLLAAIGQYFSPTTAGLITLVVGLICGGVAVTFSGPLRIIEKRKVRLTEK